MQKQLLLLICLLLGLVKAAYAEDRLELDTTVIKGNKEFPQILYILPWKDSEKTKYEEQNLILHSLFGDIFQPQKPGYIANNK